MMLLALAFLTAERCQPRDRFCTDIDMIVSIGDPGVLIPDCINNGPLQFQNREVVSFPGLNPQLTTAEVPQPNGFYAILITPAATAVPGTIPVQLHDVPDPNFPRVSEDYTIHVTIVVGTDVSPPTLTQFFLPPAVKVNSPATLEFQVFNPNDGGSLGDIGFQATLQAGLLTVPGSMTSTCDQSLVVNDGTSQVLSLSGATLDGGASCTLTVGVGSATPGKYTSTTTPITSQNGPGQAASTQTLMVFAAPLLDESFLPPSVQVNVSSSLQFTITNLDTSPVTGVGFQDTLPAGLLVDSAQPASNGCGGVLTAAGSTISLAGGSVDAGAQCLLAVAVSSPSAGTYINDAGPITASETGPGQSASATLTVVPANSVTLSAILLAPDAGTIVVGHTLPFSATGLYTDGTRSPLTALAWSSSSPDAGAVSSNGLAVGKAVANGILISATDPASGIEGTATLNVRSSGLYKIDVTPDPGQVAPGSTLPLTATGYNADGTTVNMTSAVAWSSASPSVVSVSSQGLATAGGSVSGNPVDIIATDPVSGISGSTTLTVPQVALNVSAQPRSTGGDSNLDCIAQGAGPFTYAWHGYQDDGTVGGVVFSNPNVQAPTVTMSTASGNGANFYVFCVPTRTTDNVKGSGYGLVTLSTGNTTPGVTVNPDSIHAGATDVTFDGTPSISASSAVQWVVQYGGNVVPANLEGYLTLPPTAWTTVFSDNAPMSLVETVPAADFSSPGAYRVQLTVISSNDFSVNEGTFYFQVLP
jgi:hypothetical protein